MGRSVKNLTALKRRPGRLRFSIDVTLYRVLITTVFLLTALSAPAIAQVGDYEGHPVASVEIVIEGTPADAGAQAEFKSVVKIAAGDEYSAVLVRQSLHDLFVSGRVASARVEVS